MGIGTVARRASNVCSCCYPPGVGFENGKLVRAVLSAERDVDTQLIGLHYDLQDELVQPNDPQSLADTLRDDLRPALIAQFTSDWSIQPVVVTEVLDPQDPLAERSQWTSGSATPGTKTIATDRLPRAVCAVVTLRTDLIGRRFRGRNFIPGVFSEGDQADGLWTSSKLADLQNLVDDIPIEPDIAGPGSSSTCNLCVYSRTQRAADRDPYAEHVTSLQLRTNLHWLRSRQASI